MPYFQSRRGVAVARVVLWTVAVAALIISTLTYMSLKSGDPGEIHVALITADDDAYWNQVAQGAEAAAAKNVMKLTVMRSDGSMERQNELIQSALDQGFDGIAISPVDASKQGLLLNRVGKAMRLVTVDSDSEISGRLCFVGADNYAAGRECGELIKAALPDGGRVVIVMGPVNKANGERRRQGVIDELLNRSYGPGRPTEAIDEIHEGEQFTIVATLIDEIDPAAATENVRRALEADPEINCVVGLFAYSTPASLAAVEALGRLNEVTIVGFDDRDETLEAIAAGKVYATIAQDQFSYGYDAIRLLGDVASGSVTAIPLTERLHIPPTAVTAENIETYRTGQRRFTGG